MTLSQARTRLNRRLANQYNDDDDGRAILNDVINDACRYLWELRPFDFNVVSTTTIPTVTADKFALPTEAKVLLGLYRNSDSSSINNEVDVPFIQEGRDVIITESTATPTRIVYHSFYTDIVPGVSPSEDLSSYLPSYIIIDLAQYFMIGETKDMHDGSPIMINKALKLVRDWVYSQSVRGVVKNEMYHNDGTRIDWRDGVYSTEDVEYNSDIVGE